MYLKLFSILFFASIFKTDAPIEVETIRLINAATGKSTSQMIVSAAKSLIGKPYVGHTLEINSSEKLVCNLSGLDCATFVENVVAAVVSNKNKQIDYISFKKNLQSLRYQNGQIQGYGSRIHYFSDWLVRNEAKAGFKNISKELDGELRISKIDFMSAHANLYKQIGVENCLDRIEKAEATLNSNSVYFIPKIKVSQILSKIKSGDIIAFTSTVAGLDCNHEGFALVENGEVRLLHASLEKKRVVVSEETLSEYLSRIKKHSGIIVARFNN